MPERSDPRHRDAQRPTHGPAPTAVGGTPPWVGERPATTVCATARISAPKARDRDPDWRPGDPWPSQWVGAVRVTVAQAATLQGFPAGYPWQGSRTKRFEQIGNAVCPPLARRVLAEAMRTTHAHHGDRRPR